MKSVFLLVFLMFGWVCAAAQKDSLISFRTCGPDKYADGTVVKDGECYALVWVKQGATFAGFNADGSVVDAANSAVVVTAAVAKDGHCPKVIFEVDAAVAAEYEKTGAYSVYLLDTRNAAGKVMGTANGRAKAVNGFGSCANDADASGSVRTVAKSAIPQGAPEPKITGIKVAGGYVYVTLANTVPYLQYNLKGGKNMDENVAAPANGAVGEEIILVKPEKKGGEIFRAGRN